MVKSFICGLAVMAMVGSFTASNSNAVKPKLGYSDNVNYLLSSVLNFSAHDDR